MTQDVTLRWAASSEATAASTYNIYSDVTTSGTFALLTSQAATDRGDASYAPYTTTLNGGITDSDVEIVLTDGTNFADSSYIAIGKETILLDGKSTHTFSTCTRGIGSGLPAAHLTGATVTAMHESYLATSVDFGTRNVIRYRITHTLATIESIASELLAIVPTVPPNDNLSTCYGVLNDIQGNALQGIPVRLTISDAGDYYADTGELMHMESEATTTDTDGYFELFLPRDVAHVGSQTFTLTVASGEAGQVVYTITSVADTNAFHFLEAS